MVDPLPVLDELKHMLENALERNDQRRLDIIDDLFTIQKLRREVQKLMEQDEKIQKIKEQIDGKDLVEHSS